MSNILFSIIIPPKNKGCKITCGFRIGKIEFSALVWCNINCLAFEAKQFSLNVVFYYIASQTKIVSRAKKVAGIFEDKSVSCCVEVNQSNRPYHLLILVQACMWPPIRKNHAIYAEIAVVWGVSKVSAI